MRVRILTLFPEMFDALKSSVVGRASRSGLVEIETVDIRSFTRDKRHKADDYAFGGGPGLVMYAQPVIDAMEYASRPPFDPASGRRVSLSPRGSVLTQRVVERLARYDNLALLCGHYEGIDQRALDACVDEEISIGDYILTGGEPAAIVLVDAVSRLVPGVLGSSESARDESFSDAGLLEYPQYTHPRVVNGAAVPDVLIGGNHAAIAAWKREQSLRITLERRPDLLERAGLTDKEKGLVALWRQEQRA
ncbi:MAG: tRNA (guanosine(37)-N1)-methyltransferase TrmD [Oscillospiraceae bacterium]|jgi:tRNA (guanine37-N1)-methyltransferase|nr:tRNA (guanosine(37)-N1)-methyltransferase TrmD [Oscillospiraceae bacterium]